jgi:CRP/FNR family transcriptional regulator, cyclic AMP receptor protein
MTVDHLDEGNLRKFSIFRDLSDAECALVRSKIAVVRFDPGETIIAHGATDNDVFLLLDGQAVANRYSLGGREISYRRLPNYAYMGELAVFDGLPRSVNIVALTEVVTGRMSGATFRTLMQSMPTMMHALLRDLSARVRELSERIYETTASSVKMRFYGELMRAAMAEGGSDKQVVIRNPPTHAEWAAIVGGQRESITRALSELTALGILRKEGRNLVVTDLDQLMDQIEDA